MGTDADTVRVSKRAAVRLVEALTALGVDPGEVVNPLDAAAFVLEALHEPMEKLGCFKPKLPPTSEALVELITRDGLARGEEVVLTQEELEVEVSEPCAEGFRPLARRTVEDSQGVLDGLESEDALDHAEDLCEAVGAVPDDWPVGHALDVADAEDDDDPLT